MLIIETKRLSIKAIKRVVKALKAQRLPPLGQCRQRYSGYGTKPEILTS